MFMSMAELEELSNGFHLDLACISHRIFWRVPNSRIFSVPPTVRALGESAQADKFV
jgi:hypothetical protein